MIPAIIKNSLDGSETLVFGLSEEDLDNLRDGLNLCIKKGGTVPYDVVIFSAGVNDEEVKKIIEEAGIKMGLTPDQTH